VPVTKFSEFYAGDIGTVTSFSCSNIGADTLNIFSNYYIWNYDTLFTSGNYTDTLINITGCDSVATLNLTLTPTGISTQSSNNLIGVYPNPNTGTFNVAVFGNSITPSRVRVVNVIGIEVYNQIISGNAQIDISEAKSGIYFVIIETNEKPFIQRVIKQ
jgi:hypothetical protein